MTYSAMALRCSDLDPQLISNSVPSNLSTPNPPATYLDCYDSTCTFNDGFNGESWAILNFTIQGHSSSENISANMSATNMSATE
jgi:hypothetical protein